MNKLKADELKKYRDILIKLRSRLSEEVSHLKGETLKKSAKESSGDLSGYSLHMADQATDNYDRDFMLGLAQNGQEVLYAIDEALKRIEEKTYGICESCSKPITRARLNAKPFAEMCIECQSAEEKRHG